MLKQNLQSNLVPYLARLKQDPCEHIRIEADYRLRLRQFKEKERSLPKQECNKKRQQLQKEENRILTFSHLSIIFGNYLRSQSLTSYAIADLEVFLGYLTSFEPATELDNRKQTN